MVAISHNNYEQEKKSKPWKPSKFKSPRLATAVPNLAPAMLDPDRVGFNSSRLNWKKN